MVDKTGYNGDVFDPIDGVGAAWQLTTINNQHWLLGLDNDYWEYFYQPLSCSLSSDGMTVTVNILEDTAGGKECADNGANMQGYVIGTPYD